MKADKVFSTSSYVFHRGAEEPLMFRLSPIVTASLLNCSVQAALLVSCSCAGRIKALRVEILPVGGVQDGVGKGGQAFW